MKSAIPNLPAGRQGPQSKIKNLRYRLPLTFKGIAVTLAAGLLVWFLLDYIQTRKLREFFHEQLTERLSKRAIEDRLRFDLYIKAYNRLAKLFLTQKKFIDYIEEQNWSADPDTSSEVKYHSHSPEWFPRHSIMRAFVQPRYTALLDSLGRVREVYLGRMDKVPPALLRPQRILIDKSHKQSFIVNLDGYPYLVTAETYLNSEDGRKATLMLSSPIDDTFLSTAIGSFAPGHAVALLTYGEEPEILISSNLEDLPAGTSLMEVKDSFLVTGREFLDYGAAERGMKFVSMISMSEVNLLTKEIVSRSAKERGILAITLILSFLLIMYWITQRIRQLTRHVSVFSEQISGTQQEGRDKGDKLYLLENKFQQLTEEVIESRRLLKKQAEEKTRLIVNNASDTIITMDSEGLITTWNPQAEKTFGWSSEEMIGRRVSETIVPPKYRNAHENGLKHYIATGDGPILNRQIETAALHREGYKFPIELTVSSVQSEDKYTFIAIIRDITERKKAEDQIRASLREKETLLKEIHHRVKNNMQIISSLLRLQSDELDSRGEVEMLRENQNRIKTMSLIHEKLYTSQDLEHVDFNDYIDDLARGLLRSYSTGEKVKLNIYTFDILLGIDNAIPCGLIVNELVSNALKYAFPDNRTGEISIRLRRVLDSEAETPETASRTLELSVHDNGIGIEEGIDLISPKSMGLMLVSSLANNQLNGSLELNRNNGTEFIIRFKEAV